MKQVILLAFVALFLSSCTFYLPGFNFKNFKNTPAEDLAEAVEDNDADEIEEIIKENKSIIDYKEPKFGNTALMLAVANNKNNAVRKLLELGADPNAHSSKSNTTALIIAANNFDNDSCNTEIVKELIKYGAEINGEQSYINEYNTRFRRSPLIVAVDSDKCLEIVREIVENGADVDKYYENEVRSAVWYALVDDNLEIARYLIIEKKAKIPKYIYLIHKGKNEEREVSVSEWIVDPKRQTPENNRCREEILDYLQAKGIK